MGLSWQQGPLGRNLNGQFPVPATLGVVAAAS